MSPYIYFSYVYIMRHCAFEIGYVMFLLVVFCCCRGIFSLLCIPKILLNDLYRDGDNRYPIAVNKIIPIASEI